MGQPFGHKDTSDTPLPARPVSQFDIPDELPRDADEMNDVAQTLHIRKDDLLVLSAETDPCNSGTTAKRELGEWFAGLWRRFGRNGVHIRRIHYRASVEFAGDVLLPNGTEYANTARDYGVLGKGADAARDLGLIDASEFEDRRNESSATPRVRVRSSRPSRSPPGSGAGSCPGRSRGRCRRSTS
jgi:hypothetical protein